MARPYDCHFGPRGPENREVKAERRELEIRARGKSSALRPKDSAMRRRSGNLTQMSGSGGSVPPQGAGVACKPEHDGSDDIDHKREWCRKACETTGNGETGTGESQGKSRTSRKRGAGSWNGNQGALFGPKPDRGSVQTRGRGQFPRATSEQESKGNQLTKEPRAPRGGKRAGGKRRESWKTGLRPEETCGSLGSQPGGAVGAGKSTGVACRPRTRPVSQGQKRIRKQEKEAHKAPRKPRG